MSCDSWGCKESDTTECLNWTEQILSVLFHWRDRLTSSILEKVSARYCSCIWSGILQVKEVSHEKAPRVTHSLITWVLFLKTTFIFIMQQKLHDFHFVIQVSKKTCSQRLKLNTANNCYCIIKDILKWNWLSFFKNMSAWCWGSNDHRAEEMAVLHTIVFA